MNEQLRNYIWLDFKRNNLPKYYHYFDMWVGNLTDTQIYYWNLRMEGKIC